MRYSGSMRLKPAFLALIAASAFAQEAEGDKASRREEILAALDLPAAAQSLRDKGVDKEGVKEAIGAAKGKGLKAKEARGLMKDAEGAVDEHGPVDNFGAFVKGKLDSGLRGRELAAAIKAEHAARGKGKGYGKGKKGGAESGKGVKEPRAPKEKGGDEAEDEKEGDKPEKPEKEHGDKGQGGGKGKGKDK